MKKEREFLTQLKHSFQSAGGYFFKIPDMPHFPGAEFRFDLPKPFDAIAQIYGQAIAIEAKVIKKQKRIKWDILRDSQKEGLGAWSATGGKAFVFVLKWESTNYQLFIIPFEELKIKKEIRVSNLVPISRTRTPDKKYIYDLRGFLLDLVLF